MLINQAIDAGYEKPEAYLKRSKFREQNSNPDGASKDAWCVLNLKQVPPTMVREAISRLMRLGTYDLNEVVNSPAVLSLDIDDKLWLADPFDSSLNDVQLIISLLKPLLDISELSESDQYYTKHCIGLSYMGLGRFSEAAEMFRSEGENISDLDILFTFNYAMAMWGENDTVQTDIFQRVVELDRADSSEVDDPNYLQCMAIAYWAAGDNTAALDYLKQAQEVIKDTRSRTEFSCWRYLQADKKSFEEDLNEIRSLIKKPGSVVPKFMTVKSNGSTDDKPTN